MICKWTSCKGHVSRNTMYETFNKIFMTKVRFDWKFYVVNREWNICDRSATFGLIYSTSNYKPFPICPFLSLNIKQDIICKFLKTQTWCIGFQIVHLNLSFIIVGEINRLRWASKEFKNEILILIFINEISVHKFLNTRQYLDVICSRVKMVYFFQITFASMRKCGNRCYLWSNICSFAY